MDRQDFVLHRVAFAGLPYAALRALDSERGSAIGWRQGMLGQARLLRGCARRAATEGAAASAAQYFRWAGVAYHSATLGPDLSALDGLVRVSRLRHLAVAAYRRALQQDGGAKLVTLALGAHRLHGYCRLPEGEPLGVVLLLNGLDSLCEVELHAFASGLLARGMATLSLDLPARFSASGPRDMQAERWLPPLHEWLAGHGLGGQPLGVFAVSFGGYLGARLLAGNAGLRAGLLISPPAWIEDRHRQHPYFSRMFSWSFGQPGEAELDALAASVRLDALAPPQAACRVYAMTEDAMFDARHTEAYAAWGQGRVEVKTVAAEHVGTSSFYRWLPGAFDWFAERFAHA